MHPTQYKFCLEFSPGNEHLLIYNLCLCDLTEFWYNRCDFIPNMLYIVNKQLFPPHTPKCPVSSKPCPPNPLLTSATLQCFKSTFHSWQPGIHLSLFLYFYLPFFFPHCWSLCTEFRKWLRKISLSIGCPWKNWVISTLNKIENQEFIPSVWRQHRLALILSLYFPWLAPAAKFYEGRSTICLQGAFCFLFLVQTSQHLSFLEISSPFL